MNLTIITYFTPYKENYKGISALIYYLLKERPSSICISLYSYNANNLSQTQIEEVENELRLNIKLLSLPKLLVFINRHIFLHKVLSFVLPKNINTYIPLPKEVRVDIQRHSDLVWSYPYFFYKWAQVYPDIKFVVTGCDNNVLFYDRCIADGSFQTSFKKISLKLHRLKALYTELGFKRNNILVHYVGKDDLLAYQEQTNCANAFFSPHPHYKVINKTISFDPTSLRVLIAGANDFYMESKVNALLQAFEESSEGLKNKIRITFLGKGWEKNVEYLTRKGFECNSITWVNDYIEEIIKYDIQIVPISIGTGTKGKVLDALANGLLCIGTKYALENIDVENGKSCFCYNDASEVVSLLIDIYGNKEKYERIAEAGRNAVLKGHSPIYTSKLFFDRILKFSKAK